MRHPACRAAATKVSPSASKACCKEPQAMWAYHAKGKIGCIPPQKGKEAATRPWLQTCRLERSGDMHVQHSKKMIRITPACINSGFTTKHDQKNVASIRKRARRLPCWKEGFTGRSPLRRPIDRTRLVRVQASVSKRPRSRGLLPLQLRCTRCTGKPDDSSGTD